MIPQGWHGWDEYAKYYDWENARTSGRRDVRFWERYCARHGGRVLELGSGTGRVLVPLARAGVPIVGVDRSGNMQAFARRRLRRLKPHHASMVRGDIRALPFRDGAFDIVLAPYGILQSLLRDADFNATLEAVARVLVPGGRFGIDLVPDVPNWREYTRKVALAGRLGRKGPAVSLVESVRHDRTKKLTIFDHEYREGWGKNREVRRFTVTFRTLPVKTVARRLERAGFHVAAVLGGYDGRPWDDRAQTWIVLATKPPNPTPPTRPARSDASAAGGPGRPASPCTPGRQGTPRA
jgi:ubiquinone/menaquinone biosynthesis C-methylase UbiE